MTTLATPGLRPGMNMFDGDGPWPVSTGDARRVLVIGGGVTGLSAAARLAETQDASGRPIDVTLVEATGRLGGAIRTIRRKGFLIEAGPDSFITTKPGVTALASALGIDDELIGTQDAHRRALVVRRGKLLPAPQGFVMMAPPRVGPIVRSRLFSPAAKLRMAMDFFIPPRRAAGAMDDDGVDESLASFVTRRFGRQVLDRLVQPLMAGIHAAPPDLLSTRATMPHLLEMEQRYGSVIRGLRHEARQRTGRGDSGARYSLFMTFRDGLNTLVDALTDRIGRHRIHRHCPVRRIEAPPAAGAQRWRVHFKDGRPPQQFDGVVLAAPANVAAGLLSTADAALAQDLKTIPYASAAVVHLGYRHEQIAHPLDAFGFVVPATERRPLTAVSFSSVKYADRAPDGHVLLKAFLGQALPFDWRGWSDQELASVVQQQLRQLLGARGRPVLAMVHRHRRILPRYTVGHTTRVQTILQRAASLGGLALAGNGYEGAGLPDCVAAGQRAADALVADLVAR